MNSEALLALVGAITDVGDILFSLRNEGQTSHRALSGTIKAVADQIAHDELTERLRIIEPGIPVLSEEEPEEFDRPRPDAYWLIDPLDGTASFVGGYDGFVCQAALMIGGEPVIGAVYAPALKRMYSALRFSGAKLNGKSLRVKPRSAAILIDNYPEPLGIAAEVMRELKMTTYVESGSLGLKICRVAQGEADLFIKDVTIRDWDVGAPQLVLSEAGGQLVKLDGQPFPYYGEPSHVGLIAADPSLVAEVLVWMNRKSAGCEK